MSAIDAMDKQYRDDVAQSDREQKCHQAILSELDEAERKAIDALARYKFQMFGYWAAIWVHLNRISGEKRPSPFKSLVNNARIQNAGYAR